MYHFIGIGGIGMSALARILLDQNVAVTGTDLRESSTLADLAARGAQVNVGHSHKFTPGTTVVYSSAVKEDNPEFLAARTAGLPLLHRSQLLAHLMQKQRTLAVAGTHGKTTTTALLAHCLASLDASYAIGGYLQGCNGHAGQGDYFVAEADESDGSFVRYRPYGAIVTNLEADHLDHYKSFAAIQEAFRTFCAQVSGPLLYCADDPELSALAPQGLGYGFSACALQLSRFEQSGWSLRFDLHFDGRDYRELTVPLVGRFNALNSAAAFGMGLLAGVSEETLRAALASFPGIDRRCQHKGERKSVLFLDDYAHHPTEVRVTLEGIRAAIGKRRLVALFQPHRYTRTRDHFDAFAKAFDAADHLYVTDIYSAGEEPLQVTAGDLAAAATLPATYLPKGEVPDLRPHDVCVTLGAGDITTFHRAQPQPSRFDLGLIFGGKSGEHEISVKSARYIASALDPTLYNVRYFGIDPEGRWAEYPDVPEKVSGGTDVLSLATLGGCDLYFPVLHGPFGEDGTLQGLFEILGKPYVGTDYRSAALCMDKALTKTLAAAAGIPVTPFVVATRTKRPTTIDLRYPLFVKPVHGGSSLGISRVETPDQLEEALQIALAIDTKVIVEEGLTGHREFEFAVMNGKAPAPAEKLTAGAFYDFSLKYGETPVQTDLNPQLSPAIEQEGRALAERAFETLGCSCMTRVDFFLDSNGKWWLSEMNPIPGLQPRSSYPKVWEREGLTPQQFVNALIIEALARHREEKRYLHV